MEAAEHERRCPLCGQEWKGEEEFQIVYGGQKVLCAIFYGPIEIRLTRKNLLVLHELVLRKGLLVTKERIINILYSGSDGGPESLHNSIAVSMSIIRKRFRELNIPYHITADYGMGFILKKNGT